jgi:hypothetical protein
MSVRRKPQQGEQVNRFALWPEAVSANSWLYLALLQQSITPGKAAAMALNVIVRSVPTSVTAR